MKFFNDQEAFFDERNCRKIEIVRVDGNNYYCRTIELCDEKEEIGYQFFSAQELSRFQKKS